MIHQKKGSRALWAVAFAAAPIGAVASPLAINPPQPGCVSGGPLNSISWQDGATVGSKDTVLHATVATSEDTKFSGGSFTCNANWDTTQAASDPGWDIATNKTDLFVTTKADLPPPNVFASTQIIGGDSFSINFGQLDSGQLPTGWDITKLKSDVLGDTKTDTSSITFVPTWSKVYYPLGGTGDFKSGSGKWVTDYTLDLNADDATGNLLYQDYLGVQVISGANPLFMKDRFFFDANGNLIFDPLISGTTTVNLLSSPDPAVPEPASLALMAAGLLGLAAVTRRRKRDDSGGGEPEA